MARLSGVRRWWGVGSVRKKGRGKFQVEQHINPRFPRFPSSQRRDRSGERRKRRGGGGGGGGGWWLGAQDEKKIDTTRKRESEGGCSVRSSSSTLRKNKRTAKKEEKNMPFTHVSTSITLLFVWSSVKTCACSINSFLESFSLHSSKVGQLHL